MVRQTGWHFRCATFRATGRVGYVHTYVGGVQPEEREKVNKGPTGMSADSTDQPRGGPALQVIWRIA